MELLKRIGEVGHENVMFCQDKASGLKAIIAVHNTTLGPALGGTRLWPYASEEEALVDVLRLSRAMTFKNAAAGLNLGGGKAVIMASPELKTKELLFAYGKFVERLNGIYVTAADVNTNENDMVYIREFTPHVAGLPMNLEGSGDPSPFTALGVFEGIRAAVHYKLGLESLEGVRVAVQGLGSVGFGLCKLLKEAGAKLFVSDIHPERVRRAVEQYSATAVDTREIHQLEVEVFAPCALGGVINEKTLPLLKCKIVAGAANNQCWDEEREGLGLKEKGILYCPDYIINAGGVINISFEVNRPYNKLEATQKVRNIYGTLMQVFQLAEAQDCPTYKGAQLLAEMRLSKK